MGKVTFKPGYIDLGAYPLLLQIVGAGGLETTETGSMLLGKITANLNLPTTPLENPILVTSCIVSPPEFQLGETITSSQGGTATIAAIEIIVPDDPCEIEGSNAYQLTLSNVVGNMYIPEEKNIITGDSSETAADIVSYKDSIWPNQLIRLNPNGSVFKITEILLTNVNGTISNDVLTASFNTGLLGSGDSISLVSDFTGLDAPNKFLNGAPGKGTIDNITIGNNLYFSTSAANGSPATVDIYVFGYTLK
jgi:hypothetical protein